MVTRTGIDYQKGADSVEPESGRSPLDSCIYMGSIPSCIKKKPRCFCIGVFFMVTRTGIEPMLPP